MCNSPFSGNRSTQIIGETAGDSSHQVERFIRLNKLTPDLMQLVDDGRLKTTPAVELSYLTPEERKNFSLTWKKKVARRPYPKRKSSKLPARKAS